MAILPLSADLSKLIPNPLEDLLNNPLGRTVGQQLKKDLGLENFQYVMIQKIVNLPLHIYVVTFDSRRPTLYLSPYRVKSADTTKIRQIKQQGLSFKMRKFKLTPPLLIDKAAPLIGSGTIILYRDLAGEYFADKKLSKRMNESTDIIIMDYNE